MTRVYFRCDEIPCVTSFLGRQAKQRDLEAVQASPGPVCTHVRARARLHRAQSCARSIFATEGAALQQCTRAAIYVCSSLYMYCQLLSARSRHLINPDQIKYHQHATNQLTSSSSLNSDFRPRSYRYLCM